MEPIGRDEALVIGAAAAAGGLLLALAVHRRASASTSTASGGAALYPNTAQLPPLQSPSGAVAVIDSGGPGCGCSGGGTGLAQ